MPAQWPTPVFAGGVIRTNVTATNVDIKEMRTPFVRRLLCALSSVTFPVLLSASCEAAAQSPPSTATAAPPAPTVPRPSKKRHVVVVGSGWASISFLRNLKIDGDTHVTCVSPRGNFVYTPLLPAAAVGSVEARSIVEPVRALLPPGADFIEAAVVDINPVAKEIRCESPLDPARPFSLSYDVLVVAPGSVANDFGTPGVSQYARVLRSYDDVVGLRRAVHDAWERAALPTTSDDEKKQLLNFILCGGGPTGSELAAELRDLFTSDLGPRHPRLASLARVTIIDSNSHVLSMFDSAIAEYATKQFDKKGIDLVLKSRVVEVKKDGVVVLDKTSGVKRHIPSSTVIWATGIGLHPLAKTLMRALPRGSQTNSRALVVDDRLRVKGSQGTIYALGDCATIEADLTVTHATQLFHEFDADKNGTLDVAELTALLEKASKRHPSLREHSRLFANANAKFELQGAKAPPPPPQSDSWWSLSSSPPATAKTELKDAFARVARGGALSLDEFQTLLVNMNRHLRSCPATAQVAKQQGEYLAAAFNRGEFGLRSGEHLVTPPFEWANKGSLAFIGSHEAVAKIPGFGVIQGYAAGLLWRGFETSNQQSMRSRVAVASDQVRSAVFGRGL